MNIFIQGIKKQKSDGILFQYFKIFAYLETVFMKSTSFLRKMIHNNSDFLFCLYLTLLFSSNLEKRGIKPFTWFSSNNNKNKSEKKKIVFFSSNEKTIIVFNASDANSIYWCSVYFTNKKDKCKHNVKQ